MCKVSMGTTASPTAKAIPSQGRMGAPTPILRANPPPPIPNPRHSQNHKTTPSPKHNRSHNLNQNHKVKHNRSHSPNRNHKVKHKLSHNPNRNHKTKAPRRQTPKPLRSEDIGACLPQPD